MAQLEQLIAEHRRLEDERARREAEQLAELVELARLEEEERRRVEEQQRREEEEKQQAEELWVAREKEEAVLRKKAEDMRLVAESRCTTWRHLRKTWRNLKWVPVTL